MLLKIDIDNNPTELGIINQTLALDELLGLMDEIYFEHHVNVDPMHYHWKTQRSEQHLSATYKYSMRFGKRVFWPTLGFEPSWLKPTCQKQSNRPYN